MRLEKRRYGDVGNVRVGRFDWSGGGERSQVLGV